MGSIPVISTSFIHLACSTMVVHLTVNQRVVGSSPTMPANLKPGYQSGNGLIS